MKIMSPFFAVTLAKVSQRMNVVAGVGASSEEWGGGIGTFTFTSRR
jgi:hypothetical protein